MKKYRLSEELGNIDEAFLEEVFEYKKRNSINIKKIAVLAACAVLVIGVVAVALRPQTNLPIETDEPPTAAATETPDDEPDIIDVEKSYNESNRTSFFAKIGGFDALRNFFRGREPNTDKNESAENLPIIEDVGEVMTELDTSESNEINERFRLVSAVCDKYTFYGTVEFDATGIDLPELADDEEFILWNVTTNQNFGRITETSLVSREGDILTFIFRITEEGEMPESFTISIGDFGRYTTVARFYRYPIKEGHLADLTINRSDLNVLDSVVAKNIGVVDGIMEIKAEVFPFGLLVTFDEAQAEQWQKESEIAKEHGWDWYKYSMGTVYAFLKIEMKDGTVYDQYYDLTCNIDTWRDLENDEEGVKHIRYTFAVPLDVSQIAKITYCGAEFEF